MIFHYSEEQLLGRPGHPPRREARRVGPGRLGGLGPEAVVEALAEDLAEEGAVRGDGVEVPLGARGVPLVHVDRDELEEERRGRGRRRAPPLEDPFDLALLHPREEVEEPVHLPEVAQAVAVGLGDDGEVGEGPGRLEEVARLDPLEPERGSAPAPQARQEEGALRVLAEARPEHRRVRELREEPLPRLVRTDAREPLERHLPLGAGSPEEDAVVGGDGLDVDARLLAEDRRENERPGEVHAAPEERADDDARVAQVVRERLEDDGAVGGEAARLVTSRRTEPTIAAVASGVVA